MGGKLCPLLNEILPSLRPHAFQSLITSFVPGEKQFTNDIQMHVYRLPRP